MVRYHSLVIDAKSLPKELIPIAWTSSGDALSFFETQKSNIMSDAYESQIGHKSSSESISEIKNGNCWPFVQFDESRRVLMGIMHSSRPHYGLQVGHMVILLSVFNYSALLLLSATVTFDFLLTFSFIQRVLPHIMGGKYSRILERSQRIIGWDWSHMLVNWSSVKIY